MVNPWLGQSEIKVSQGAQGEIKVSQRRDAGRGRNSDIEPAVGKPADGDAVAFIREGQSEVDWLVEAQGILHRVKVLLMPRGTIAAK